MTPRSRTALTLQQALDEAPTLARLSRLAAESTARLDVVRPLLPPGLRELVRAGAALEGDWCLLVPHNAAAAKLRQMAPALLAALRSHGHAVETLRVKVARPP